MQPDEVVAAAVEILERPDFTELGRSSFRNALHQCHGIAEFSRDISNTSILKDDLNYSNGHVAIQLGELPSVVRRILTVITLGYGLQILDRGFRKVAPGEIEHKNYFGFSHRQTYSLIGKTLNLNGVSSNFTAVQLLYLTFPPVTINELGELEADSWILDTMPDFVVASLVMLLAKLTKDKDTIAAAQSEFVNLRFELLQNFGTEIVDPNDYER